jgi:hypothetical protein
MVPVEMPEDVSYEGVFGTKRVKAARLPSLGYAAQAPAETDAARPEVKAPLARFGPRSEPYSLADEKEETAGARKDGLQFRRIVLTLADGTRIVVEEDGEVWKVQGRTRTLAASLDAVGLADLRRRLHGAGAASWPAAGGDGTGAVSRLLVEGAWGTTAVALPAADAAVNELAGLLESWGA